MLEVSTTSTEGFESSNKIREHSLDIDATGENSADTQEVLLATYGSCYVPALRVAAKQRDIGDLGEIQIDISGDLNDDDKLESITFDVSTETDLSSDEADAIVDRANELCKVHAALKKSLGAKVNIV